MTSIMTMLVLKKLFQLPPTERSFVEWDLNIIYVWTATPSHNIYIKKLNVLGLKHLDNYILSINLNYLLIFYIDYYRYIAEPNTNKHIYGIVSSSQAYPCGVLFSVSSVRTYNLLPMFNICSRIEWKITMFSTPPCVF